MFRRCIAPTIRVPYSMPLGALCFQYFNANHQQAPYFAPSVFMMPSISAATRLCATPASSLAVNSGGNIAPSKPSPSVDGNQDQNATNKHNENNNNNNNNNTNAQEGSSIAAATPSMTLRQIFDARRVRLMGCNVVVSPELGRKANDGYIAINGGGIVSRRGCGIFNEMLSMWQSNPGKVALLCGGSGSGKTCMALDVATFGFARSVVFFLEASALSDETDRAKDRDSNVIRQRLLTECSKLMNGVPSSDKSALPPNFDNLVKMKEPDTHVFIIVDDCASKPSVLCSVISVAPELSVELHNKIFDDQATSSSSRVHFITAGRGGGPYLFGGANPEKFQVFNI